MLIVLTLALALPQTADTRCTTYYDVTRCRTTTSAPPPSTDVPDFTGVFTLLRGNPEKRRNKKIGKLVAEGRCDEAREVALKAGDFRVAEYVGGQCVSRTTGTETPQ